MIVNLLYGVFLMYTVQEVVERLEAEGITSSRQMVQRWLKEGRIKADKPLRRKDGYKVTKEALEEFIASWNEARRPKRSVEEYEAEIQRLEEEMEQVKSENVRLQEELARAEDREKVLSADLHNSIDKLEASQKKGQVDWKKKYDQQSKRMIEKTNRLIAAEQEIEILKMKMANPGMFNEPPKP